MSRDSEINGPHDDGGRGIIRGRFIHVADFSAEAPELRTRSKFTIFSKLGFYVSYRVSYNMACPAKKQSYVRRDDPIID